jgi:hypothetical protein
MYSSISFAARDQRGQDWIHELQQDAPVQPVSCIDYLPETGLEEEIIALSCRYPSTCRYAASGQYPAIERRRSDNWAFDPDYQEICKRIGNQFEQSELKHLLGQHWKFKDKYFVPADFRRFTLRGGQIPVPHQ